MRPKILAIDIPEDAPRLRAAGFNVDSGSFGTPIQGEKSDRYFPVPVNGELPNATEQELIIADLEPPSPTDELGPGDPPVEEGMWQRMDTGVLDPRPYAMDYARAHFFERIHKYGGAFILFTAPRVRPRYEFTSAKMLGYGSDPYLDNWSLLSALNSLDVQRDYGAEIKAVEGVSNDLANLLEGASFNCTIEAENVEGRWLPLGTNKYGKAVAGVIVPPEEGEGLIFLLPRLADKSKIVLELLEDTLPRLAPKLFPEDERRAWTSLDIYALPGVGDRQRKINEVEKAAEEEVANLREEIESLETEHKYLHDLLTASGDALVASVKQTLENMGLADVRDVDQEEGQVEGRLSEDLQIWRDPTPNVLVEVKGIAGMPRDDDVFQVLKNVPRRIKEWERFDVRSLAVFNHQRGLPPLERVQQPFQAAQIDHAVHEDLGLITTWDLYRLARGYADNEWQPEDVSSLLTETNGRIEAIPAHYQRVGEIENYFEEPKAMAIQLDEGATLKVGDRLGFVLPVSFYEETLASIQIENKNIDTAPAGAAIGVKTALGKEGARRGLIVYRIGR